MRRRDLSLNEGRPFRAGNPTRWQTAEHTTLRAQRRPALPGRQPGDTSRPSPRRCPCPLNEGRPFRAGNPCGATGRRCARQASLNEGRPFRAGNPGRPVRLALQRQCAQRRPALPGRQPLRRDLQRPPGGPRSTKAGPSGPATRGNARQAAHASRRSTKAGPSGPATPCGGRSGSRRRRVAQRRPALPGRQPCPTSTIGALSHTSNMGECAKGSDKQRLRLLWPSVLKDHSRFADRYRTHGSPNSCDRDRPSVVRDSWIGPAKR